MQAVQKAGELKDWITTREAAQIMGVTPQHVNRLVGVGQVVGQKVTNRLTLVSRKSAEAWKAEHPRQEKSIE